MERKTKVPITRANMWYDQIDFELDLDIAKEYLENDSNIRVVLFQVDRANTQVDDVYGESETNDVRFHPPVELVVSSLKIEPAESKEYDGRLSYVDRGPLTFGLLSTTLSEKGVDIRRGDFIGYAYSEAGLQYWTVQNDGRMNMDNAHTVYGIRPYYRTVTCIPADPNQFNAL